MSERLSERELEIMGLVATGASNKQIAQQLVISTNTVKVHLRNIFAKLGVGSRTEATLRAIQEGLVQVAGASGNGIQTLDQSDPAVVSPVQAPDGRESGLAVSSSNTRSTIQAGRLHRYALVILGLGILLVVTGVIVEVRATDDPAQGQSESINPAVERLRWQAKAELPAARSGLAVATYENQIYAIAGETSAGITARLERYDPTLDAWATLMDKPVAVADVAAAVIGGQIYVPGGRLASGAVTGMLEVYDPREDAWGQRARLPIALSAYALAASEGRLYLFGGWNGREYVASVYEYDPDLDTWTEKAPMPTARGYSAAAVADGKIYVIGGTNGGKPVSANEEYVPEKEATGENPWRQRADLPESRSSMGVVSIANIIHVIGGESDITSLSPLLYFPQRDEWQQFQVPEARSWSRLGLATVETHLYAFGGLQESVPTTQHLAYQAIYAIVIPVVK